MLSEISQGEKGKHCVVTYLWNMKERKEGGRKGRKGKFIEVKNTKAVAEGENESHSVEWVAFPFSRGSSQPKDWTQVFYIAG